jgi:hypothetical protein
MTGSSRGWYLEPARVVNTGVAMANEAVQGDSADANLGQMELEFALLPEDLLELWVWNRRDRPGARLARRELTRQGIWSGIGTLGTIAAFLTVLAFVPGATALLLVVLGLPAGLLLLWCAYLWHEWGSISTSKASMKNLQRRAEGLCAKARPYRLIIDAKGLRTHRESDTRLTPWANYAAMYYTNGLIISKSVEGAIGILPKRLLGAGVERQRKIEQIERWMAAGGGGPEGTLYPLLARTDVACPSCRYGLRGVRSQACPECGFPLDPLSIAGVLDAPEASSSWVT